jgi:hypothetical protein
MKCVSIITTALLCHRKSSFGTNPLFVPAHKGLKSPKVSWSYGSKGSGKGQSALSTQPPTTTVILTPTPVGTTLSKGNNATVLPSTAAPSITGEVISPDLLANSQSQKAFDKDPTKSEKLRIVWYFVGGLSFVLSVVVEGWEDSRHSLL